MIDDQRNDPTRINARRQVGSHHSSALFPGILGLDKFLASLPPASSEPVSIDRESLRKALAEEQKVHEAWHRIEKWIENPRVYGHIRQCEATFVGNACEALARENRLRLARQLLNYLVPKHRQTLYASMRWQRYSGCPGDDWEKKAAKAWAESQKIAYFIGKLKQVTHGVWLDTAPNLKAYLDSITGGLTMKGIGGRPTKNNHRALLSSVLNACLAEGQRLPSSIIADCRTTLNYPELGHPFTARLLKDARRAVSRQQIHP